MRRGRARSEICSNPSETDSGRADRAVSVAVIECMFRRCTCSNPSAVFAMAPQEATASVRDAATLVSVQSTSVPHARKNIHALYAQVILRSLSSLSAEESVVRTRAQNAAIAAGWRQAGTSCFDAAIDVMHARGSEVWRGVWLCSACSFNYAQTIGFNGTSAMCMRQTAVALDLTMRQLCACRFSTPKTVRAPRSCSPIRCRWLQFQSSTVTPRLHTL